MVINVGQYTSSGRMNEKEIMILETKENISSKRNPKGTVSKNKTCEEDELFKTVTRNKKLQTRFTKTKAQKEKPDDSHKIVASTT